MNVIAAQPKKAQRLIVGGSLQPLPAAGEDVDPADHYKLPELTKRLLAGVTKHLRKDLAIELAGHGLGGVAAVLLVRSASLPRSSCRPPPPLIVASVLSWCEGRVFDAGGLQADYGDHLRAAALPSDGVIWRTSSAASGGVAYGPGLALVRFFAILSPRP